VFNSYVKDIYKHKVNAENSTQKSIAKSLLNNLLGRINKIYSSVNNLSKTPFFFFFINTVRLDFNLDVNNKDLGLLHDINKIRKYENLSKRTKYPDKLYKS